MTLLRLIAAVALLTAPASAAEFSIEKLDDAVSTCRTGNGHDGQKVEDVTETCRLALELVYQANQMGLCYDGKRYAWRTCQFTDD